MFRNPFDGAKAKVARGRQHIDELVAAEQKYLESQPLEIELVEQGNGDTFGFATAKNLPTLVHATIVADVVANYRASLDIAVSQACLLRGQTDKKLLNSTYFAFGGDRGDWHRNLDRRMAGADAVIRDTVESFRPWKDDGNTLLYALSKICAKDKHVDLLPVAARPGEISIDGMSFAREDGLGCGFQSQIPLWGTANKIHLFTVLAPAKVKVAGPSYLVARIGFGEVDALTGQPVIPALRAIGVMCAEIIDTIEKSTS